MVDRLFAEEDIVREEGGEPGVSGPSPGVNSHGLQGARPPRRHRQLRAHGHRQARTPTPFPAGACCSTCSRRINQNGELVYRADLVGFSKLRDYKMPLRLKAMMALAKVPGLKALASR